MLLQLEGVACAHQGTEIVTDLNFNLGETDIACLLGPSGCGKTTTLRTIAGFEPITRGSIQLKGRTISSTNSIVLPEHRNIGMVFQNFALFPHLTIQENVAFGLNKLSKVERLKLTDKYLELVQLTEHKNKMPDELSGGQQQRVALARTLAPKPDLILMDEPFSNLDVDLRRRLASEIRGILKEEKISCILVTHDQEEAFAFADHIGVIRDGKLEQWDTPFNIYHEPKNRFVATFVGLGHFIRGTVLGPDTLQTEFGDISGNRAYAWPKGTQVDVLVRPDDIIHTTQQTTLRSEPDYDEAEICSSDSERCTSKTTDRKPLSVSARVINKTFSGATTTYTLRLATGAVIDAFFSSHSDFSVDTQIDIALDMEHLIAFDVS